MPRIKTSELLKSLKNAADEQDEIPKTVVRRLRYGRQTRLSFSEYLIQVFMANEDREQLPRPLTDTTLKEQILNEFGHYDTIVRAFVDGTASVTRYRLDFNHGRLLRSHWPADDPGHPPLLSLRYSANGVPIYGRNFKNPHVLTNGELRAILERHDKVRETYEQLMRRLGRKGVDPASVK